MLKVVKYLSTLALCGSFVALAAEPVAEAPAKEAKLIPAFTAKYNILHKGKPAGTGVRELTYAADGTATYSYETNIEWLIFSDTRKESSTVKIEQDKVVPLKYSFKRTGTGPDSKNDWQFIPEENLAIDLDSNEKFDVDFSKPHQDRLSYHLQQQLSLVNNPEQKHFVHSVLQKSGKTKYYVYEFDKEEEILLPYGIVKTLKFKREVTDKNRTTYIWFAPEMDYLLVRLYQVESGVEQFEAQLDKYTLQ